MRHRNFLIAAVTSVVISLASFFPVAAASTGQSSGTFIPVCSGIAQNTGPCQDSNSQSGNTIIKIIKVVIDVISFIVGLAAIFIIIVSGMKMVVASGDSKALSEAKTGIVGAIIGILVVVLAQGIVVFVLDRIK